MPKLNICATRRPSMTRAQYSRYVRDDHARLVLGTDAVARHLRTYVQQHVYDGCYGPAAPAWRYDSVSHLTADTLADHHAASSSREYKEIIAPDEARFADQRSPMFLMFDESPLPLAVRGASTLRLMHYLRAGSAEAAVELRTAWAAAHQAVLDDQPALFENVRRATLNMTLSPPGAEAPPYAGMCELGFLQRQDEPAMATYVACIEARLAPLIQQDAGFYLLAEAVPVRGTLY